jgi:hypothetical protein
MNTLLQWAEGWIIINGLLVLLVILLCPIIVEWERQARRYRERKLERRIKRGREKAIQRAELYQLPGRGMRQRADVIAIGDRRRHVVRNYPGGRTA